MEIVRQISELREVLRAVRRKAGSVGFVPTMGALHDGHLSLVRAARERDDTVVLSIFVNPLQFGPRDDLSSYPRDEAGDLAVAEQAGVDIAFLPSVEEMYPSGGATKVSVGRVSGPLEGEARPGHFDGVATVVAKLFNLVRPDRAYFGQKDAQQVAVIKAMVRDLSFPLEVVVCPTVREVDGLAMSSRNAYLKGSDREAAAVLWRALEAGRGAVEAGASIEVVEKSMQEVIATENDVTLGYARAVDPETFEDPLDRGEILLVVAARVGPARLIDNLLVER